MDLLKPFRVVYRATIDNRDTPVHETPQEQAGEQMVIMGVPRAWLRRGIQDKDFEGLFNEYLGELRTSVTEAYGEGFEETREGRTHRFTRNGLSIDYTAFSTAHGGTAAVYAGNLVVEQLTLDLQSASQFVRSTMKHHVTAYQEKEPEFMIFHAKKGEGDQGTLSEGRPLLERMGIEPTEGCRFHFGGGVALWYPVDLKLKPTIEV